MATNCVDFTNQILRWLRVGVKKHKSRNFSGHKLTSIIITALIYSNFVCLPFWSSSISVIFRFDRLPFLSSSIFVVFPFGFLPFWSSSFLVVFHFGRLPFWSSSIFVVFHFG